MGRRAFVWCVVLHSLRRKSKEKRNEGKGRETEPFLPVQETSNPANGTWSFDNIFAALMQVFVVASANTWTDSMYSMMDSDYFVSCLFFIACLVICNYWMYSLFVACITR